ncbi:ABC transporter permease [Candidatus Acetothermia bacterium]|nr:ABC transporter permease [Candidatus Acetothermia bacterium]
MNISEAHKPGARFTVLSSLARIGKYTLIRLITIGIAVVVGILLTIFIANWGGHMDEIKRARIWEEVAMAVLADEALRLMPLKERETIIREKVAIEKRRMGLERPFLVRTPGYLTSALTLNLGWAPTMTSPSGSRLVRLILTERLAATLVLFGTAQLLLFFITLFSALFLSRRYGSWLDKAIIALAPTSAAPGWFYGIFLILIFAIVLGILPFGRMVAAPPPLTVLGYALSLLEHLILPVLAIIIGGIFAGIYGLRTFFLIHSSEDYVEMAKARGLPSGMIERRYVLRPTLPPIIMSFALTLIGMWMGGIILETVFVWPGLGSLLFEAIGRGETPVIVGSAIVYAYLLAATLFIMDIVFALVDPRVKVGAERRV